MIGIVVGLIAKPGSRIDDRTRVFIGNMIIESHEKGNKNESSVESDRSGTSLVVEIHSEKRAEEKKRKNVSLINFIVNIIPENIFTALANGENLKIIFFCIILGIMMQFIPDQSSNNMITILEGVFDAFQKVITIALYFLPFGLASLVASQISGIGISVLSSLLTVIILVYITVLIIFIIATIVIWRASGKPWHLQFKALKDVIIIALGTRSSFATIPSSLSGLTKELDMNEGKVKLVIPLGITLCRYGNTVIFSFMAVFAAQLYGVAIGFNEILVILIGSVLASMATSGAPGIVARTMIGLVLTPLGIPSGAIIVILLAIDPVIDPVLTLLNVYPNCASATLIAKEKQEKRGRRAEDMEGAVHEN